MKKLNKENIKRDFKEKLKLLARELQIYSKTKNGDWSIKGFIDINKSIYTISSDTKVISKIIEIHIFPKIYEFAEVNGFKVIVAEHQNYYPDISFVNKKDENIKFALDIKTTYRIPNKPWLCNGFTLGSHGKYFEDRNSTKNVQFPYGSYIGHFCLGVIYDRNKSLISETKKYELDMLDQIKSVITNIQFFAAEKWKIASDKSGSGNTANIGSINNIEDIINENGMFSKLGESWFDDYWINYRKIKIKTKNGKIKPISTLKEFVEYRGGDINLIVPKRNTKKRK